VRGISTNNSSFSFLQHQGEYLFGGVRELPAAGENCEVFEGGVWGDGGVCGWKDRRDARGDRGPLQPQIQGEG